MIQVQTVLREVPLLQVFLASHTEHETSTIN
jgi:hypothetical protein